MSRKNWVFWILPAFVLTFALSAAFADEKEAAKEEPTRKECVYVGVKKCAFCHVRLDNSLRTWVITKHAHARDVLRTADAKKFSPNPDEDPKCLKCHMTGMASDPMQFENIFEDETSRKFEGVQCEMCHGPGSFYKSEMARALPEGHELDEKECTRKGLVIPNEKTCRKCHNEECPVFHGFDFEKAVKLIKHGKKEPKCEYIGQEKCTFCHVKADESQQTWVILKHVNSFSVLKTTLAKKFSKDPVHDEKCLECHSTGLNAPGGYKMDDPASRKLEGVQCEMCHGWGYSYVETMAKAKVLDVYGVKDDCVRHGLVLPTEQTCLKCHNERCPVFTGFDFEASLKQLHHGDIFKKH